MWEGVKKYFNLILIDRATSFPESLISPLQREGEAKKRDSGNEVVNLVDRYTSTSCTSPDSSPVVSFVSLKSHFTLPRSRAAHVAQHEDNWDESGTGQPTEIQGHSKAYISSVSPSSERITLQLALRTPVFESLYSDQFYVDTVRSQTEKNSRLNLDFSRDGNGQNLYPISHTHTTQTSYPLTHIFY